MPHESLDHLQEAFLRHVVAEGQAFEARFGKTARRFFDSLPSVFALLRRLSLDLDLPVRERRLASAAFVYVVEPADYLRLAQNIGPQALVDDLWVAFETLRRLRATVGDAALSRHVRTPASFSDLADLAENADTIKDLVPPKVLEQLERFLETA